ncbi:uncharacterized protein TNCT_681671 [Trichonephila clavata]|uniref:Uncharacterized protein n=1 Tax=Trichonephila clavata TaxID=2740835 RepID=A0A8X6G8H2_TRICU|nr:uncharacterized protein TNCT_681671 [Trichonephila clavata]
MPGSLLLSHDAYSDVSDASGRSLDSKIGGKKVSFNNAVRVKQYPWKPDFELNRADHLTLPSNRFWFKVYKNKHDSPTSHNFSENSFKANSRAEENMECIHDSLAPIAEVDDQELDVTQTGLKATSSNQRNYYDRNPDPNDYTSINNSDDSYYYRPSEPPVDYFEEMHLNSNRCYDGSKTIWKSDIMNGDRYNYNNFVSNSNLRNHSVHEAHEIPEEPEENIEENNFHDGRDYLPHMLKLPRMVIRNDSPFRRSVRRFDDSDTLKKRERRSRSHDDYLDNDSRFKQLKKADKSVSTEDLNFSRDNSIISNRFLRGSRDMATQCYGTLNREKNANVVGKVGSSLYTQKNESERLNNFRPSTSSRKTFSEDGFKSYVKAGQAKKESLEDEFSKRIRPYHDYQQKNNLISSDNNLNYKKYDTHINGKVSNGINRILPRSENTTPAPLQRQNRKTYKAQLPRADFQTCSLSNGEPRKPRENNPNKFSHDSATVGYLRGRQIPLSEVNTNTSRKFFNKNENGITNRNRIFQKTSENGNATSPNRVINDDLRNTKDIYSRKCLSSNLENSNGKSHKNGSNKTYASVNGDIDNSMIDWSLSGFQLASKPDNGITSVSDSEYTVHRRPPLLMYIPGVSHHDRPALEDDRLSALSDVSRSEMNDGLSSLASSSKGKNSSSDIRRRHSMPRDGKLKWIKWKNKG